MGAPGLDVETWETSELDAMERNGGLRLAGGLEG